jgi:hypothetical protein
MKEAVRNLRRTERQNFRMLAQNISVPAHNFSKGNSRNRTTSY